MEPLEEIKKDFNDAIACLGEDDLDKEECHDLKNTVDCLVKQISNFANKGTANWSPIQFFNLLNAQNARTAL